jgi:dihydrofolate reductase
VDGALPIAGRGGGPDLVVWGSTTLTPVLFGQGLVDDVVLCVIPVLLGRGKRFFTDGAAPCELAFVGTQTTPTGVLLNTYRYVGAVRTPPSPA